MKQTTHYLCSILTALLVATYSCSSGSDSDSSDDTDYTVAADVSAIAVNYTDTVYVVKVTANREWSAYSSDDWMTCTCTGTTSTSGTVSISIDANSDYEQREGTVTLKAGTARSYITVTQAAHPELEVDDSIEVPDGYKLVWHDEFDDESLTMPDEDLWYYEVWAPGTVNNELQRYVAGQLNGELTAEVSDGTLKIYAKKVDDEVISARINTYESWKYGYFEARLKLPTGKGTWPAFWMLPYNYTTWPDDGEIDIMEEVGYNPNYVSSSIHCLAYYHSIGTQKTKETYVDGAQTEFHTYALKWTEDYIRTYIDGDLFFSFANDGDGNKDTWPFYTPFYVKLNLAWGGDWGGAQGVDESCLPATYEIDYVRVFQEE